MPSEHGTIHFRMAASPLDAALASRAGGPYSLSLIAKRDLERYYELLRRSLPAFTEPEASLIVDACNGWHIEPHTAPLLWAEVADAIKLDRLDAKWGVDGKALIERLRALTPFESLAVCDACERFWQAGVYDDTAAGVRAVGLVRDSG